MKYNIDLTGGYLCCGGSSGRPAVCKAMANAGADVALVARRVHKLEENANRLLKSLV